ncbi:hypothetical protein [Halomonas sp. 25-S5]|nr:hypothetical protein [Halomonas sp. 25-S5]
MAPLQQALDVGLEVAREVVRRLAIDPDGAITARHQGGRLQPLGIDVVRQ